MYSPPRPAGKQDHNALLKFINSHNYLHRHLDWCDTLDWLGHCPFLLLEENGQIQGALACPPDPSDVAWVRMFGVSMRASADKVWQMLFEPAAEALTAMQPRPVLVSLALRDWFGELLQRNGFQFHQDIVVFTYSDPPPLPVTLSPDLHIRQMRLTDLEQVAGLDYQAFEPIWRLSNKDLLHAFHRCTYSTVMEQDGTIIAYQMSTLNGFYAHLARLAVRPDLQRRRVGYAMVQNLLEFFLTGKNCWGVTLNTQHDNTSSLALYHKIGFRESGERFPVFVYPLG